jgi:aminoglycoside phosphotransferase (APT) family kinase protein
VTLELPPRWADLLRAAGHRPGAVLGSGMEGTVIDLGGNLVVKVWHRRPAAGLETLRAFYDTVAGAGLPFATPVILEVLELDGQCASVEPLLRGRPLWLPTGADSPIPGDRELGAVVDVLAALAAVPGAPGLAALPVLEGEAAFDPDRQPFERSLADLVERRVETFRAPLTAALPDLEAVTGALVDRLRELEPAEPRLLHGDLIPANVLVDDESRPVAVLDFGFLTTVGDPAFDAAVAASIFDMYGPHAAATETQLDEAVAGRFGHDPARLALHRAAYALVTSNCFSSSGSDGHFAWCMRMLRRRDVRDALGL